MRFLNVVYQSLAFGLLAVVLWVLVWSVAFPEVWAGYDNHIMRVFFLSCLAYVVFGAWAMLSGQK